MSDHKVYFDSAATTKIHPQVIERMMTAIKDYYGNPSSTHSFGRKSKSLIENARKVIAKELHAHPSEITFTSGGTEANNMILRGCIRDLGVKTVITSKMEHHAVLHTAEALKGEYDINLELVKLKKQGEIDLDDLRSLLEKHKNKKTLVSLMFVNNEVGNLLPIEQVAKLCKEYGALFHSDTVQGIGHFRFNLEEMPIDFLSASAHKFHGPKGIGFAYIRKTSKLNALIVGGEQERGLRAGTEALHDIVGLEEAFLQAYEKLEENQAYVLSLKQYLMDEITKAIPQVSFNGQSGDLENSTYTVVNLAIPFTYEKGQILLFQLDLKGVACSKGSACQSGSVQGSHVLSAFLDEESLKKPSLRFSFSHFNTKDEVDYAVKVLSEFYHQ